MKRLLEIACFNLGSAIIAEQAGADRIELCSNYWEGGVTPSERTITEVRERIKIPVHVIIRSRAGDYVYSDAELNEMNKCIDFCNRIHIDGVVIGALTEENEIDIEATTSMLDHVAKMSVTFHRAVDHCQDLEKAFSILCEMGIKRVLTSGGEANVVHGWERLKKLNENFGDNIIIMPGGGLRSSNILQITQTGCNEFHSSALTDNTVTANADEIIKLKKYL